MTWARGRGAPANGGMLATPLTQDGWPNSEEGKEELVMGDFEMEEFACWWIFRGGEMDSGEIKEDGRF